MAYIFAFAKRIYSKRTICNILLKCQTVLDVQRGFLAQKHPFLAGQENE